MEHAQHAQHAQDAAAVIEMKPDFMKGPLFRLLLLAEPRMVLAGESPLEGRECCHSKGLMKRSNLRWKAQRQLELALQAWGVSQ